MYYVLLNSDFPVLYGFCRKENNSHTISLKATPFCSVKNSDMTTVIQFWLKFGCSLSSITGFSLPSNRCFYWKGNHNRFSPFLGDLQWPQQESVVS